MYRPRTLYLIAVFLLAESAAIVLVHSRLPRPARALTAGINAIAAITLVVLARQRSPR